MPPSPRVRCDCCEFEWFGATAAHGLRIVGTCPRCGGGLSFLTPDDAPVVMADPLVSVSPAAVLGMPTSWNQ